jgi:hypothetical protein
MQNAKRKTQKKAPAGAARSWRGRFAFYVLSFALLLASPLCARSSAIAMDVSVSRRMQLEAEIEPALAHVEQKTGLKLSGDLSLVLIGNASIFAQHAASDGVSLSAENVLGYADSSSSRIVLNLAAIDERQLKPKGVLRHELAHLVMGSALLSKRPLWFEEGVALWVENMPLDALMESAGSQFAPPTYQTLDDLDVGLRDNREAGAAYAQARSVVELLAQRYGEAKVRELLQKLRMPGVGFTAAFKETMREELRTFERNALQEIASRQENWWVLFLGANWWWMLFTFGAVLAFFALLRRKQKTKSIIDEWEEQEKLYPSDPSWSYADDDPTEGFREELKKKIGERDEEEVPPPVSAPSAEELKHWYDVRNEKKPPKP